MELPAKLEACIALASKIDKLNMIVFVTVFPLSLSP